MAKFIVAGKYGFMTAAQANHPECDWFELGAHESHDVRAAYVFTTLEEAVAKRFRITDGEVLEKVSK